jgi:hypothetical protein
MITDGAKNKRHIVAASLFTCNHTSRTSTLIPAQKLETLPHLSSWKDGSEDHLYMDLKPD